MFTFLASRKLTLTYNFFKLFVPYIMTQWLQFKTKHVHTCYNLISQIIFCIFRGLKL